MLPLTSIFISILSITNSSFNLSKKTRTALTGGFFMQKWNNFVKKLTKSAKKNEILCLFFQLISL